MASNINRRGTLGKPFDVVQIALANRFVFGVAHAALLPDAHNEDYYEQISVIHNTIKDKKSTKLVSYNGDYNNIFFNYSRIIFAILAKDSCKVPTESAGIGCLRGHLPYYDQIAFEAVNELRNDYDPEGVADTTTPILPLERYLSNTRELGDGHFFSILVTGIQYSLMGLLMTYLSEAKFKKLFAQGKNATFNGKEMINLIVDNVPDEKMYNAYKFAVMYSDIIEYLEVLSGKPFTDRFCRGLKAMGKAFKPTLYKVYGIKESDDIYRMIEKREVIVDVAGVMLVCKNTQLKSSLKDIFDVRSIYHGHLLNDKSKVYNPPFMSAQLKEVGFGIISGYKDPTETSEDFIDIDQYSKLIMKAVNVRRNLTKLDGADYVTAFYELTFLDKCIDDKRKLYTSAENTPLRIVGLEGRRWFGNDSVCRDINQIPYPRAYKVAMDTIGAITARYYEFCELTYITTIGKLPKEKVAESKSMYRDLDCIYPGQNDFFVGIETSITDYCSGKLPFTGTISNFSGEEIVKYIDNGEVRNEFKSLLNRIDLEYVDEVRSVSRSVASVFCNGSIDIELISSRPSLTNKIVGYLKSMTDSEKLYISR